MVQPALQKALRESVKKKTLQTAFSVYRCAVYNQNIKGARRGRGVITLVKLSAPKITFDKRNEDIQLILRPIAFDGVQQHIEHAQSAHPKTLKYGGDGKLDTTPPPLPYSKMLGNFK